MLMSDRRLVVDSGYVASDIEGAQPLVEVPAIRQLLREPYPYLHSILAMTVRGLDVVSVAVGTMVADWFEKSHIVHSGGTGIDATDLVAVMVFCLFPKKSKLLAFPKIRRAKAQVRYLITPVLAGWFAHVCLSTILMSNGVASLKMAVMWAICVCAALSFERSVLTFCLHQPAIVARLRRRVAIVGTGAVATDLVNRLCSDAGQAYSLFGQFDDTAQYDADRKLDGTLDDLIHRSRREALHAIILAFPEAGDAEARVRNVAVSLKPVLSDIYVTPHLVSGFDRVLPCEFLGENAVFVIQRRPLSDVQLLEKTVVDFLLAFCVSIFLLPFLIGVALAIKCDSKGPVFFRQPRIGKNGREFMVYKFRSMHTHMSDLMAERQTSRDDPRVTRIGKWLRRLSIDEVPQLLNVLKGEMSLVGPRPHAPHTRAGGLLLDDALAEYVLRYHVKPGITGWAQINGARGELVTIDDLKKRVAYDLDYIRRWSLVFDFRIMILTIVREVFSRHAF